MFNKTIIHNHEHNYESPLQIAHYNPKEDIIAIFVGTEDDIPPIDIMEQISDKLKTLDECNVLIAPGIFKIVILKGVNK